MKLTIKQEQNTNNKNTMTDKTPTPEGWEQDWEKVNKELNGVNPHAYRLGWLQGRKPLEGIDNPAEWVEKMKRIAGYIKLGDNFYGIDIADILEANHNLEAKRAALQAENERLKKEITVGELAWKLADDAVGERNDIIKRLRAALTEIRNYNPATSGYSNEAAMKRIAGEALATKV